MRMSLPQNPQVGAISPDGQFQWDGQDWMPLARVRREPTAWTPLLQRAAIIYFVVGTLELLITTALFTNSANIERVVRAQSPSFTNDQVQTAVSVGLVFTWLIVIAVTAVMVFLAFATMLRWRWAFWVVLAWFGLSSLGVATNTAALVGGAVQAQPRWSLALGLLIALAALGLLVWFIMAAARYGPWAMKKPGAT